MPEQNTQKKEDIKVVLKEVLKEEALKEKALKEEAQNKKAELRKPRIIRPQVDKPEGFVEVHFEYKGGGKQQKDKIYTSYVSPEVAELYRASMENTHDKRKKVRTGILKIK